MLLLIFQVKQEIKHLLVFHTHEVANVMLFIIPIESEYSAVVKDYEKDGVNTNGAKFSCIFQNQVHHSQRYFADVTDL